MSTSIATEECLIALSKVSTFSAEMLCTDDTNRVEDMYL